MKLSTTERLILANQYRILAAVGDASDAGHNKLCADIFANGYEALYSEPFQWIMDPLPENAGGEVLDILSMFDALQHGFDQLEDSTGIEKNRTRYGGFDGNNETNEMAFAQFFCERLGRFESLERPNGWNSHMPMMERYRPMLDRWRRLGDRRWGPLVREDILTVLG